MTTPDLSTYRAIHRALRVAAAGIADAAATIDRADEARRKAFARYWNGYAGEVLVHHTVEDDYFFPALVERVPMAAELISRTDADHHHLDELMDSITVAVASVRAGRPAPELVALTRELSEHMDDHLDFEDADVLPLFERHFDLAAYEAVDTAAVKSVGVGRQAAFTVPFVMAALAPDEARETLRSAPVPLRILYFATRGSHARLTRRAFGRSLAEMA
jgi:hemerythrin-like domain-containing protein